MSRDHDQAAMGTIKRWAASADQPGPDPGLFSGNLLVQQEATPGEQEPGGGTPRGWQRVRHVPVLLDFGLTKRSNQCQGQG